MTKSFLSPGVFLSRSALKVSTYLWCKAPLYYAPESFRQTQLCMVAHATCLYMFSGQGHCPCGASINVSSGNRQSFDVQPAGQGVGVTFILPDAVPCPQHPTINHHFPQIYRSNDSICLEETQTRKADSDHD